MAFHGLFALLVFFIGLSWVLSSPVPQPPKSGHVLKRDGTGAQLAAFNPYAYGLYPGIKPLRPFKISDLFLNRFPTPTPPVDPVATFFKTKKDEFLNKLFDEITADPETPSIEVRSVAEVEDTTLVPTAAVTTTPKPKIDPSVFISKKFDFLTKLFKTINATSTPAPDVDGVTLDPTATTVKPTIVPPGFWVPFPLPPKTPKPPKPSKAPKPAKTKNILLDAMNEALLKSILSDTDPSNPLVDPTSIKTREVGGDPLKLNFVDPTNPLEDPTSYQVKRKVAEALPENVSDKEIPQPLKVARKLSFLDEFLHRVTTPSPVSDGSVADDLPTAQDVTTRSLYPPGYWIPPYIYAAKMGIYLDKIFDTIDAAAVADDSEATNPLNKRSAPSEASTLILTELTNLKNSLLAAFNESAKAKPTPTPTIAKKPAFKKPTWGPKTTPAPDATQEKIALLSDVFDHLAEIQQLLLTGQSQGSMNLTSANPTLPQTTDDPTTIVPPSFWIPDPASPDIASFYKDKTQEFLGQLFSAKGVTPSPSEDEE